MEDHESDQLRSSFSAKIELMELSFKLTVAIDAHTAFKCEFDPG